MTSTQKLKVKTVQPVILVGLLNQLLANTIDFRMSAKQAHWNVRGENFMALHELFDRISTAADIYADQLAERAVQLGGAAQGDVQTVSCQSSLFVYPQDIRDAKEHIKSLSMSLSVLADDTRHAIDSAIDAHDMVTADLLTEITRGFDKLHWYLAAHTA